MNLVRKFLLLSIILICISCGDDVFTGSAHNITESVHYPLITGHTVEYEVFNVTYYNEGRHIDTSEFQIREVNRETLLDGSGKTVHLIDRFVRENENSDWLYQETFSRSLSDNEAVLTEGNRRQVKLIFPAVKGEEWDANKYFDTQVKTVVGSEEIDYFKQWISRYDEVNTSVEINGRRFDQVHTVSLADYENKLELRYGKEFYAAGIGLIYRELWILDTQCFTGCEDIPWESKAERGHIWIQKILHSQ